MQENPYKYTGPLYPDKDKLVCIQRNKEIEQVISGILRGDYWTILGPRQIGKTTFLNQLINELSTFICLYFDMEVCPENEQSFYEWLIEIITDQILATGATINFKARKDFGPEIKFYNFLRSIEIKDNNKIIFFFDEIAKTPSVKSFLHLWRKIFNERKYRSELNKYEVVIAGSVDLIALTIGPTSPFNISKKLYLEEFTEEDANNLISEPIKQIGIKVDETIKEELIFQTSCHPQLLQHLCCLLVDNAMKKESTITRADVQNSLETLFVTSDNLNALRKEIQLNNKLKQLVEKILKGEKIQYLPYQDFNISGTGPIIEQDDFCAIRNRIYEDFLRRVILIDCIDTTESDEAEYVTTILIRDLPQGSNSFELDEKFLHQLFMPDNIEIHLELDGAKLPIIDLDFKEKLIFCYLGYKNLKAHQKGFSDWKRIPQGWEYRLSSHIENNRGQIEWDMLEQVFSSRRITVYDEIIRSWISSIRQKLKIIAAEDLIPKEIGRGKGYLIKGKVEFAEL